jgi:maltose phosphorylase
MMYLLRKAKIIYQKLGGYTVSLNHKTHFLLLNTICFSFSYINWKTKRSLVKIWEMSDTIEGDVKAQQGIRFNIFQLNQTYLEKTAD